MKSNFFIAFLGAIIFVIASCKSKSQKDAQAHMDKIEKTMKENSPNTDDQKTNRELVPVPEDMKNIVGEWELVKIFSDDNGNHRVDAGEDNDATSNLKDFLKLNADGTCEYTIAKLEGRYEIITKEDSRKRLTMYDRTGTETTKGRYIVSVTENELVINRIMGGSDFEIFKRL